MFEFKFEAFGTELEVKIFDQVSLILQEKIKSEVFDYTVYFDETLSRFKENSLVTKISRTTGVFEVSKELVELLEIYQKFYYLTDGSMNPLVGQIISELGYDAKYSLIRKENISTTPPLSVVKIIDTTHIETVEKVLIDVRAIGKGFWVDKVSEIIKQNKVNHFLINGSGDIYYNSPSDNEVSVNLQNSSGEIFAKTKISNTSICGSGTEKRNWSIKNTDNLHHIIDANTSRPTENISNVWIKVKAPELPTTFADGLATAIFFIDPETLKQKIKEILKLEFEYLIIPTDPNKKILVSKNFDADFLN